MTLPNTREMMPSEARAAITTHILGRLAADPTYTYAKVLGGMETDIDGYAWSVLDICWAAARGIHARRLARNVDPRDAAYGLGWEDITPP